jgi:two-component system, sensor histidine kinase YesM
MIKELFTKRIAVKIVLAFLLVILIPTTLSSLTFYLSSSKQVKENVRNSSIQIARQAADSLSFIFSVGSDMSDKLYSDEDLQQMVVQDLNNNLSSIRKNENNEAIDEMLNQQIYSSSFVSMVYVLKEEGQSWGSGTFSSNKFSKYSLIELEWIKKATEQDGKVVWQKLQYDKFSSEGSYMDLILPIGRVMKDFDDLHNIGFILVGLDGKSILKKINQLQLGNTGHFFVVDQEGNIMIDSDLQKVGYQVENKDLLSSITKRKVIEFEYRDKGILYYGVKQQISNGWFIVGVVPVKEITGELDHIRNLIFISSIIFTIIAIGIGLVIARKITKPIKLLTNQMKQVGKGNLAVRTQVESNDEIGTLSSQFNQMIVEIEQLLEKVNEEEAKKMDAELRAIKHRINPHFLFNTLSTIRWLMKFNQQEKAIEGLEALNLLLEANMGKKGHFVTIKEELDIIEKFIAILQIRYDLQFNLAVDLNTPGLELFQIPKMLLQPLVENAIFHGIVPTGKNGEIYISVKQIKNGVEIMVEDNGIGFDPETLNIVTMPNHSGYTGIGLSHVYESVQLYFSKSSMVDIQSNPNKGTTVTLLLYQKAKNQGEV